VSERAPELARLLREVELGDTSMDTRELAASLATDHVARLVNQLLAAAGDAARSVVAVGILGCEAWRVAAESRCFESLVHTAELAEQTGLTMLDSFPARDLARGGQGGPAEAHGLWLLLADRPLLPGHRWRALVHLEHSLHVTVIPPLEGLMRREPIISCDVCPGMSLFDELYRRARAEPADATAVAKVAVQGKCIPAVFACWQRACGPIQVGWQPRGVSALPLTAALDVEEHCADAALPDLLKTAARFIAARVATFVTHGLPPNQPIGEVILTGEGARNGLLVQELRSQLPVIHFSHLSELGLPAEIFAASVAALTLLHLWQVPVASGNGSGVPRLLGRITPGKPSNWQQVLRVMNSQSRWLVPLSEAV
jgi:1,6-anhydro-N-acetylmuramate kinase